MFNIYYINYGKAFEIAMLIDNKILDEITRETENSTTLKAEGGADAGNLKSIPLIGKYAPNMRLNGEFDGVKTRKVIDAVKVISTKSTILEKIYNKAKEISKLQDKSIGNLIKIKNVSLEITNENDILGVKTFLSGALGDIALEGGENINLTTMFEVVFKDSAYILKGTLPKEKFKREEKIIIKIPMQAENEMENQYSISDLEIGKVTIIGIYRGNYKNKELNEKLNRFLKRSEDNIMTPTDVGIESDIEIIEYEEVIHFIDVIAIVQDINF